MSATQLLECHASAHAPVTRPFQQVSRPKAVPLAYPVEPRQANLTCDLLATLMPTRPQSLLPRATHPIPRLVVFSGYHHQQIDNSVYTSSHCRMGTVRSGLLRYQESFATLLHERPMIHDDPTGVEIFSIRGFRLCQRGAPSL